jgi:hypothetical protein
MRKYATEDALFLLFLRLLRPRRSAYCITLLFIIWTLLDGCAMQRSTGAFGGDFGIALADLSRIAALFIGGLPINESAAASAGGG